MIGRQAVLAKQKKHPQTRALRLGKRTYAALTATLQHYRRDEALTQIPVWRMISRPLSQITAQARHWAEQAGGLVLSGESTVGGGSLPGASLPTSLLAIETSSPDGLVARPRQADPPVIARVSGGRVLLDPRTVLPEQEMDLMKVLLSQLAE